MRIAVSMPFGWPYVRRGNRFSYELAVYMASQGHNVHYITTKPGPFSRYKKRDGMFARYYPVIENQLLKILNIDYWQTFGISCMRSFFGENFDVVLTTVTADGFVASLNRRRYGTPFIHYIHNGEPVYRDFRRGRFLFRQIVRTASRVIGPSGYVVNCLKMQFGRDGIVLHSPVDTEKFYPLEGKDNNTPKILCTASMVMERKRVPLLVKAFEKLIDRIPQAILQLGGETTPEVTRDLLMSVNTRARESIRIVDITTDEALAAYYRNATITVLPSLNEPFGMVTTESLASGTPVVGARSGGTPEILVNGRTGVLFEPMDGPGEISEAMIKGIELAGDPDTGKHCRENADRFSWKELGPKYEALYLEVVDEDKTKPKRQKRNKKERESMSDHEQQYHCSPEDALKFGKLRDFFIDTLDSLDITEADYYELYSQQPKCLYILDWIHSRGLERSNILVLSSHSNFLTHLFEKLGFFVTERTFRHGPDLSKIFNDGKLLGCQEVQSDSGELFDIIVCDDVLKYLSGIEETMESLKARLKPGGLLLLTAWNAARGSRRLALLAGKNIYPEIRDLNLRGEFFKETEKRPVFYREYTLQEVTDLVSRAHLQILEGRCFRGKQPIYKTVSFTSVPFKTVFLQQLNNGLQKIIKPLGSHIFVAAQHHAEENSSG